MTHLDILLPFGLPPEELGNDLLRELKLPALATLVARARAQRHRLDSFSRALPHEAWIAQQFGLENTMQTSGSPPVAVAAMRELGLSPAPGTWFIVNPVHFHIARDHIVLTDQRQLLLEEQESRALFDTARQLVDETSRTLLYGSPTTWFLRADDWAHLQTSTPDAATGHNIDLWMPKGEGERNWRKLQNEIQMHWFIGPINAEREARGLKPVNSIWLWAGTPASMESTTPHPINAFNLNGWMQSLAQLAATGARSCNASEVIAAASEHGLLLLDALLESALANDWSQWLAAFHELETAWFAPLLAALKEGKIDQLSLVTTDHARLSTFTANRHSLRKFWIKPSLAPLLS